MDRKSVDRKSMDRNLKDRKSMDRNLKDRKSMDRNLKDRKLVDRKLVDRKFPILTEYKGIYVIHTYIIDTIQSSCHIPSLQITAASSKWLQLWNLRPG